MHCFFGICLFVCLFISQYQKYHNIKYRFYFLLGLTMVPRETGNNAYAKFWRDKQRVLWYFWYWQICLSRLKFLQLFSWCGPAIPTYPYTRKGQPQHLELHPLRVVLVKPLYCCLQVYKQKWSYLCHRSGVAFNRGSESHCTRYVGVYNCHHSWSTRR